MTKHLFNRKILYSVIFGTTTLLTWSAFTARAPIISVPHSLGLVWAFTILIYTISVGVLLKSELDYALIFSIFSLTVAVLLLPIIFGFEFNGFAIDAPKHFANIIDISHAGRLDSSYIYPGGYLLVVFISEIIGFSLQFSAQFTQVVFYTMLLISFLYLSKTSSIDSNILVSIPFTWLVLMVEMTGTYTFYFAYTQSLPIFIFCVSLVLRTSNRYSRRSSFLLIGFLTLSIVIHPLTTLVLIVLFGSLLTIPTIRSFLAGYSLDVSSSYLATVALVTITITVLLVSWSMWATSGYISTTIWRGLSAIIAPVQFFTESHRLTQAGISVAGVRSNYSGVQHFLWYYAYRYGPNIIVIFIGSVATLANWRKTASDSHSSIDMIVLVFFIAANLFALANGLLSTLNVGPVRLAIFPVLLACIALSRSAYLYPRVRVAIVLLLTISTGVGVSQIYPPPDKTHPPLQITEPDVRSHEWLFSHMANHPSIERRFGARQYHKFLYGDARTQSAEYFAATRNYYSPTLRDVLNHYSNSSMWYSDQFAYLSFTTTDDYLFTKYYPNLPESRGYRNIDSKYSSSKVYSNGFSKNYVLHPK